MGLLNRRPKVDPQARENVLADMSDTERTVTHAAAIATGQARIRLTDRRLLILFVVVIGVGAYLLQTQSSAFANFKRVTNFNCHQVQHGLVDKLNGFYDGQIKLTQKRTDLPPKVKAAAIANDIKSKVPPLDCGKQ